MNKDGLELLKKLSKSGNYKTLFALKDGPKRWSDLLKIVDQSTLSLSIRELSNLGLIQINLVFDTPTGSKAYQLSPLGKKVVQLLEQIEKEFEEYHSHLPKEPDKFINELLEDK
uniref:HTH hxlR-type domain-containing protein n=1 Tax=Pleomorphic virus ThalV2 TaxID=3115753 RepID=A0AAT9J7T3_9VIRU